MSGAHHPAWTRGRRPVLFYVASAFAILVLFSLFGNLPYRLKPIHPNHDPTHDFSKPLPVSVEGRNWTYSPARDSRNLGLSDEQCDAAFPGLYTEIDRTRDYFGPRSIRQKQVKLYEKDTGYYNHSQVHVLIYNGQMYIIDEVKGACDKQRGHAGLANLYRSIISVPDPSTIPNVEFILDTEDTPTQHMPKNRVVWGWTRPMDKMGTWVAPDFDGWAFPNPDLGAYVSFRERVKLVEQPFEAKDARAVWRGTVVLNSLRGSLVNATQDKEWADVQKMRDARMHMADFCKYQFPIHTEGNSWSGRLRYLQNCHSAVVVHQPLKYQAHYYDLLVADGPDQNYIKVANDFSDLEEKIEYYRANPLEAERIANNSVSAFRDRYLTPAAEACYWRRMIKNWSEVQAFEPTAYTDVKQKDGSTWKKQRGLDWEIYAHPDSNYGLHFPVDEKA